MANYIDKLEFHKYLVEYRKLSEKLQFDNDIDKYNHLLKQYESGDYVFGVDLDAESIDKITKHKEKYVGYIPLTEEELKTLNRKKDKVYNEIGKRFILIAKNFGNKPRYINYSQDRKDDMIAEGYYDMLRYIDNYDHDGRLENEYQQNGTIPDPFSYFSTYAKNGCGRYLQEMYGGMEVFVRLPFLENMDKKETVE